ncbi:hypothetical protein NJC38_22780 [Pseudomonas sp. 21LCFQ010]|uniref:hypothetical protein n=1 Tax=Pseudomonas sp. 21LCFQ010 TaxID=2957506 RepID=UPI00209742E3|nr:hypothetical protein [Pseudomonas sp. 21LCFQ010]MCO8164969.1 hypothetical protein [Pseudomonas sp. 21LCFQ010]
MFFNRKVKLSVDEVPDLSVKVELLGLSAPASPIEQRVSLDQGLKLIACWALIIQAAFSIYGYSILMGEYDALGIDINEISLSTQTLLLYGYMNLFSGLMAASNTMPTLVPSVFALVFFLLSAMALKLINRHLRNEQIVGGAALIGIVLFVTFFVPAMSVQKGVSNARAYFSGQEAWSESDRIKRTHSIETSKGILTGQLVLADTRHSYLLVSRKLYKIDSATGKISREVVLSPIPQK